MKQAQITLETMVKTKEEQTKKHIDECEEKIKELECSSVNKSGQKDFNTVEFLSNYKEVVKSIYKMNDGFTHNEDLEECDYVIKEVEFITRRYSEGGKEVTNVQEMYAGEKSILLKAVAGMGKTATVKHVFNQWSIGKALPNKNLLLFFQCREFNHEVYSPILEFLLQYSAIMHMNNKYNPDDMYEFLEQLANDNQLMIIIDGIDELILTDVLNNNNARQTIKKKVLNKEKLTGEEAIVAILDGHVLQGSKLLVTGRMEEIQQLQQLKCAGSGIFNPECRRVLTMAEFSDEDIKTLICRKCGDADIPFDNCEKCQIVYGKLKGVELKRIPCFCKYLIEIFKDNNDNKLLDGNPLSKSKIILLLLFQHIREHGRLLHEQNPACFSDIFDDGKENEIKNCLQNLIKISKFAILKKEIKIYGKKDGDAIIIGDNKLSRRTLAKLNLFFVRKEKWQVSIEPHHLVIMEFLGACGFALDSKEDDWRKLLNSGNRMAVFPMIAGILNMEAATKDFLPTIFGCYKNTTNKLEELYTWLLSQQHRAIEIYEFLFRKLWYWVSPIDDISRIMPVDLLVQMIAESFQRPNILPRRLEYDVYSSFVTDIIESFINMEGLRVIYDIGDDPSSTVLHRFLCGDVSRKVILKGRVRITYNDELSKVIRSIQLDRRQISVELQELQLDIQREEEGMSEMIHATESLCVSYHEESFSRIMNVVESKPTNSRVWSLKVNNLYDLIESTNISHFHSFIRAALTVRILYIINRHFTKQQWKYFEEARKVNHNIKLEWLRFGFIYTPPDFTLCIDILKCMKVITFNRVDMNTKGWDCLANVIQENEKSEMNYRTSIIHRFQLGRFIPLMYANSPTDGIDIPKVKGVMLLELQYMNLDHITHEALNKLFRNIRAIRFVATTLTEEQCNLLGNIGNEDCILQELWFQDNEVVPIYCIKELTFLKVLRLENYATGSMVEVINLFMEKKSSHWLLLEKYRWINREDMKKVLEYHGPISRISKNEFSRICELFTDEKNKSYKWNLEIQSADFNMI